MAVSTTRVSKRGFALLLTITLLAFLVLLVVSLGCLTRVETQVAFNNQAVAQARHNALLALNVALGQLQRHAGLDARITARGEITSTMAVTNPYFTGVWNAGDSSAAASVWLVSGSECVGATAAGVLVNALDPSDDAITNDTVFLVGDHTVAANPSAPTTAEKARRIKLTKQDINAPTGLTPGAGATVAPRIGRYAWWIGDQGVKASLALSDRSDEVTYPPWDTPLQRRRIRQQVASTPNYFRAGNATTTYAKEGFDPITVGAALGNVKAESQLGLVVPVAGSMGGFARDHFHDFTTVARAVLANTRTDAHAGLMRDLSLKPDELGAAYARYAGYCDYMETPGQTLAGAHEAYPRIEDVDSPRRRYRITAPVTAASAPGLPELVAGVAPVLADFLIQFRFFHSSANKLTVRSRLYVGVWNPYTAALAPTANDGLAIEITGLPSVTVTDEISGAVTTVDLQAALSDPIKGDDGAMRVELPFGDALTTNGTRADRSSWLPGRIYGWTTAAGLNPTAKLGFYTKSLNVTGWSYPEVALAGGASNSLAVSTNGADIPGLIIRLRSATGVLATYTMPSFAPVDVPANAVQVWQFGFGTSLKQPLFGDSDRTWLKTFDPRSPDLAADSFGGFDVNQDITPLDPNVYASGLGAPTVRSSCLLYRIQGTSALSQGSYNDVPVFELPRLPLLSTGELQHMQVKNRRPFAIGNSWGGAANAIFDRYFFSGLPAADAAVAGLPDLRSGQPLPNWNLHVVDAADIETVRAAAMLSSRHLLQAGGFNLNSTSAAAWRAVLSGGRFSRPFAPADIENAGGDTMGTQKDSVSLGFEAFDADATLGEGIAAPTFLRFPQSAQETYFWKPVSGTSMDKRQVDTHAFRLGVRGSSGQTPAVSAVDPSVTAQRMTTDQVEALAEEIVRLIKVRAALGGPFRTLQEFLGPQSGTGSASILEAALANTGINPTEVQPLDHVPLLPGGGYGSGYSSLTLAQADILTALAPYLRTRSDTFTIRSYGEAVNPVTSETTGKAWLEATVQRFPETVDAADNIEKPTGAFGRRFKIISFRWLSPSDI